MVLKLIISHSQNDNTCLSLVVSDSGLSSAALSGIIGLCVGVTAVLLLIIAGVIYYRKRQAGQRSENYIQVISNIKNV